MAISNMQQARQLRAGGGIMDLEPRQGYFLGKAVKKLGRGLKKVVKSPLGKAALAGAALYGVNKFGLPGIGGKGSISNFFRSGLGKGIGNLARTGFDKFKGLSTGKQLLLGGGALATALPFFMGGGEEEEEITDTFEVTPGTITDIVSQARSRDPSLRFLPQNAYTQSGFFNAADGGIARAGYAMGGPTEDVMVENIDTQEVVSNPDPMAELNMLSIELFGKPLNDLNETERGQLQELIQSRMQQQGQDRVMANSGGMMDYMSSANPMADSYIMEDTDIVNMYRPGGERQMAAEGGIMDLGGMEKDYRNEGGFVPIGGKEKADDVPARLSKN